MFGVKKNRMNDYRYIEDASFLEKNIESVSFLENNIEPGDVVFSHHIPHEGCLSEGYRNDSLNIFFVNYDLEQLILDKKPSHWVYGHSHEQKEEFTVGKTVLCCNPWGYFNIEPDRMSRTKRIVI